MNASIRNEAKQHQRISRAAAVLGQTLDSLRLKLSDGCLDT
ncbi:hypothetical protein LC55x_5282 [Lysobacter capsici]|nr:hypothetical protein LC55x_5282 [Lysobacter capsici]